MSENPGVWEIRVGVHATERQAREVVERIQRLLCQDPDHAGPCAVPWSTSLTESDDYPELHEQYEIERASRD
ncbi:hypothetical protein [Actinophytocola gossypii]|uniref:SPOR domain-containing protein n=1 Tax=Actinophytocola gossypii TaxID=2812003 RepID=A0ABT2JGN6_9PSEU|nr:hypothetical protein [Actinophytocola gossypii]MCT2587037.1 hypothetical protein [Actinophytocola gossypii]